MYAFDYLRPASLDEASTLLGDGAGRALAGGQTLLGAMKLRMSQSERLVDLGAIPGLRGIEERESSLVIGAMTRHAEVARSAAVRRRIPALASLAAGIGDVQVRNMGTIGGSVANNDPAACYPSALLALAATVHTTRRSLRADAFFTGFYSTALEEGELIVSVEFPVPGPAAYVKFHQPASRFALIGVFVAQTGDGARVAVTGGGAGVFRAVGLEAALDRQFAPDALIGLRFPPDDLASDLHASAEYRAHLIPVLTARAVEQALRSRNAPQHAP
jgi:carbon-monoxide dehydrogenase medium subunit